MDVTEYTNANIKITKSRWRITINITEKDGTEHTFLASADSSVTYNDGIWFGTPEEYEQACW